MTVMTLKEWFCFKLCIPCAVVMSHSGVPQITPADLNSPHTPHKVAMGQQAQTDGYKTGSVVSLHFLN